MRAVASSLNLTPIIDLNYYATELDRVALHSAVRKVFNSLSTEAIDARLVEFGLGFYHPGGTCVMGKVVDGECKVIGMQGLRVVDVSIMPLPLAVHYQATVYALAEKVADII
jgi:choline dehydrogenase-like flavoprotein